MVTRRKFLQFGGMATASAVALSSFSAASYARIIGANDRINIGIMGARSRGRGVMNAFLGSGNCTISHLCDVDSRVLDHISAELTAAGHRPPKTSDDIRRTLEDKNLDALVIAAPDHWHAPAAIMAMQAGKHVYVEKPCSHNPHEGELLVQAQKKYNKVVQMGNQQRSSLETLALISKIRAGDLGDIYKAYTWYANDRKSIGQGKQIAPPQWLNWDLWQGPAPRKDYMDNYVHYNWHWFWHWGTAEVSNNGAHELDIARWAMGLDFAEKVSTNSARRFYNDDDWQMYDTMEARFDFAGGKQIIWEGHSCNRALKYGRGRGTLLYGTKGSVIVDRGGYEIYNLNGDLVLSSKIKAYNQDTSDLVGAGPLTFNHARNFMTAVRGDSHNYSPIDEGHKSTLMCQLANISHQTGQDVLCDPTNGHVKGAAAQKLWQRDYQKGWEIKV